MTILHPDRWWPRKGVGKVTAGKPLVEEPWKPREPDLGIKLRPGQFLDTNAKDGSVVIIYDRNLAVGGGLACDAPKKNSQLGL